MNVTRVNKKQHYLQHGQEYKSQDQQLDDQCQQETFWVIDCDKYK